MPYPETIDHISSPIVHKPSLPNTNPNGAGGATDSVNPRLDISALDRAVDSYFRSALAPSSRRTYASAQQWYLKFCTQFSLTPLPLIEHQLCQFVSYLANDGLSHVSIKGYLAALRHLQISSGLPDPAISAMPKLEGVVKGIKEPKLELPLTRISAFRLLQISSWKYARLGNQRGHHTIRSCSG